MTRNYTFSVVVCFLSLLVGLAAGWQAGRAAAGLPGQLIRVTQTPTYKPVEIVPDSVSWPAGEPVAVATVEPPTKKEARKLEKDFGFRVDRTSLLGKFDLPDLPDGGRAVVSVPVSDGPEPVSLRIRANPPPLVRVGWNPELQGWLGYSTEGNVWSSYVELDRILCIRDRVCLDGRAGYEHRLGGSGPVAEAGVSIRF